MMNWMRELAVPRFHGIELLLSASTLARPLGVTRVNCALATDARIEPTRAVAKRCMESRRGAEWGRRLTGRRRNAASGSLFCRHPCPSHRAHVELRRVQR